MIVRRAEFSDAAGINAVYNPFIRQSPATFETEEYSLADREAWIDRRGDNPARSVFVAEEEGRIVGFANASEFDPREGYKTSVKVSVFVDPSRQGDGFAARLYEALFRVLAAAAIHRAYALIVEPNPASEQLHRKFGFVHVATLDEVGQKFGRFHNVMWFEKRF